MNLNLNTMYIFDNDNNSLIKVEKCSFKSLGLDERNNLQEWIAKEPSSLGEDLLIIQKEFDGFSDTNYFCITQNDSWTDELIVIFLTISMLFIGFSREKDEDECIASIRMNALVWAIMVNSALLIVGTLLIYGLPYLNFMSIYMFSLLILFVFKYRWMIYKFRKTIE